MVTLQSVQGHTGLTHPFEFFWHSGTLSGTQDLAPECPLPECQKIQRVGSTSMALNALVDSFCHDSKSVGLKGLTEARLASTFAAAMINLSCRYTSQEKSLSDRLRHCFFYNMHRCLILRLFCTCLDSKERPASALRLRAARCTGVFNLQSIEVVYHAIWLLPIGRLCTVQHSLSATNRRASSELMRT